MFCARCAHFVNLVERISTEEQSQNAGQQARQEDTLPALELAKAPCSLRISFHSFLPKLIVINRYIRFVEHLLTPPGFGPPFILSGADEGPTHSSRSTPSAVGLRICLLSRTSSDGVLRIILARACVRPLLSVSSIPHLREDRYDFSRTPRAVASPVTLALDMGNDNACATLRRWHRRSVVSSALCSWHARYNRHALQDTSHFSPSGCRAARRPTWAHSTRLLPQRGRGFAGSP